MFKKDVAFLAGEVRNFSNLLLMSKFKYDSEEGSFDDLVNKLKVQTINVAFCICDYNVTHAAKMLNLKRTTLMMMMRRFNITVESSFEFCKGWYFEEVKCVGCKTKFFRPTHSRHKYCNNCLALPNPK